MLNRAHVFPKSKVCGFSGRYRRIMKNLPRTNAPAYFAEESLMKKKSLMLLTTSPNITKQLNCCEYGPCLFRLIC
jgi:hypothetical protein